MKTMLKFSVISLLLWTVTTQATITVTNIAQGSSASHSLFIRSDGSLWGMGRNNSSELGSNASINVVLRPKEIVAHDVAAAVVGADHSLFLKSDGSLWAMGNNGAGQLGDGTFMSTNRPEEIVACGVTAIAAGYLHSLFLKSDGSLWAMGNDEAGQLGDSTYGDPVYGYSTNQPEEVVASNVIAIAAGEYHSLFLKSDGSLWAMGENFYGQLGDGRHSAASTNQPEEIVASNVTAIAAGGHHSLFLKSDGSLWGMGWSQYGQLGDGAYNLWTNRPEEIVASGVTAIAAGEAHTLFLKSDGSLWAMGDNIVGQLGDGFVDGGSLLGGIAVPEQILPPPSPVMMETVSDKTNMRFTATCLFGGDYYLLAGTNLTQPLNQWIPVGTNTITYRYYNTFSATLTNAVNSGSHQFYILQSQ